MITEDGNSKIFKVGQQARGPGRTDAAVKSKGSLLAEFSLAEMK